MNAKAIEGISVSAVNDTIRLSSVLSPYISENDKSPSFDGYICIHQNARQTKKNLKRVNVQVKGCEKKKFNRDNITYAIDIEDLKNFKANGGCLLFVVYIRQRETTFETKVYYQELTPVKIFDILASTKAKSRPSVLLKALPQKPDAIATIVLNCYEQCRMQSSFTGFGELPQLEELEKKGIIESIKIPLFGYGIRPKYPAAFNNYDVYMYAKLKNSDVWLPLQGQPQHMIDKQLMQKNVSVDGKTFYDHYYIVHDGSSSTVLIGDSFRVKFTDNVPGCSMEYKAAHMLRTLLSDSSFMLAAIESNGFEVGGARIEFDKSRMDLSHFNVETQKNNLKTMKRFIQALDLQGCSDDLDLSKLTTEDYKSLNYIATSTIDHKPISGLRHDLPPVLTLTIGNLRFALWFKQSNKDPGTYTIYNALDYMKPMYTGVHDKNNLEVPVSIIFDEEAYLTVSNIQFDKILPSFEKYQATPYIYDISNSVMLLMISASDKAIGIRKKELLDTAMDFAIWLESMPSDVWDRRISILNRLQIVKRLRTYSEEEFKELFQIAANSSENPPIMVGTNILLEHYKEANFWLKQMSEEEQAGFTKFPIFNLWKETILDGGNHHEGRTKLV